MFPYRNPWTWMKNSKCDTARRQYQMSHKMWYVELPNFYHKREEIHRTIYCASHDNQMDHRLISITWAHTYFKYKVSCCAETSCSSLLAKSRLSRNEADFLGLDGDEPGLPGENRARVALCLRTIGSSLAGRDGACPSPNLLPPETRFCQHKIWSLLKLGLLDETRNIRSNLQRVAARIWQHYLEAEATMDINTESETYAKKLNIAHIFL